MLAFFDSHSWAVPVILYIAAALLTSLARFSSSAEWDAWALRHKRAATFVRVVRALLPYVPKAVEILQERSAEKKKENQ